MPILLALASGLLFGAGLALSGMMDPQKVLGFLDLTGIIDGRWNPSLAFVMGGALAVTLPTFRLTRGWGTPLAAPSFGHPSASEIDHRLIVGSVIFGAGWGLAGYCPGPAVASLSSAPLVVAPFVAAMLSGMVITRLGLRSAGRVSAAKPA